MGGLRRSVTEWRKKSQYNEEEVHAQLFILLQLQHILSIIQLCFFELKTVCPLIAGLFCNFFLQPREKLQHSVEIFEYLKS